MSSLELLGLDLEIRWMTGVRVVLEYESKSYAGLVIKAQGRA